MLESDDISKTEVALVNIEVKVTWFPGMIRYLNFYPDIPPYSLGSSSFPG